MPLTVQDYSWTQSETMLYISVPLKGIKPGKVDVFAADDYLKVNFPPFLFEVFLFEPIDDDKSVAKIGNGVVIFSLLKKKEGIWDHLALKNGDKDKMREIRARAMLKAQEKCEADAKAKAEKTQEEKKYALQSMMKLEDETRARIKQIKQEEQERVTVEMEAWKTKQTQKAEKEEELQTHMICVAEKEVELQKRVICDAEHRQSTPDPTSVPRSTEQKVLVKHGCQNKSKQVTQPAPRSCSNIQVKFTPRVFPTALRESRVAEEEEWLKKQAEARRVSGEDLPELNDLKQEERNPDWLKEKGNKLFATGNYLAAVSAYTLAIQLNRNIPALYSNRAACHLKLRNLHKAVEDSSEALSLLTPAVPDNAAARFRAHLRRGTAFCQLQLYAEGLQDYQSALKIEPHNAAIQADAEMIRKMIQGSPQEPSSSISLENMTGDEDKMREIRARAMLKAQEKCEADAKAKAEKTQEEKKYALQSMMKLEDETRARIKQIKQEERERVTVEMEAWKTKRTQKAEKEEELQTHMICVAEKEEELQTHMICVAEKEVELQKRIICDAEHRQSTPDPTSVPRSTEQEVLVKHDCQNKSKQVTLPAPRSCSNIQVKFTPRVFPTALRESRVAEEEKWLKKQAEARRVSGEDLPELNDLKQEERNPDWLKEKGNKLFATGNYLAAVSAYTLAIQLNRNIPALYSNRAACHLKLRNLHKAVEDSSKALSLLTPAVPDNAAARLRAHLRRGSAFCQLQLYAEGLQDYQSALKIEPHNAAIQADAEMIRKIIQGSPQEPSSSISLENMTGDEDKMREIRARAMLKAQEKCEADAKAKAEKTQEEKKYALQSMMKLEDETRARIKQIKQEERERVTVEMEAWKSKQTQKAEKEEELQTHMICVAEKEVELQKRVICDAEHRQSTPDPTSVPRSTEQEVLVKHDCQNKSKQVTLPAPRSCSNIQVKFTPRVFPTALRESRVAEEEEWFKKQAEARRVSGEDLPELNDLKQEERNPDWLKEKGNKLFATGNYLAAVSAYTLAIQLNRNIPALYSNRAACHLKLRNLHKAVEDSSKALSLLTPAVPDNAAARLRAHLRRGSAFCQLQLYAEGLKDYQSALKIDPHNEAIQADAEIIRKIIQGCPQEPSSSITLQYKTGP